MLRCVIDWLRDYGLLLAVAVGTAIGAVVFGSTPPHQIDATADVAVETE